MNVLGFPSLKINLEAQLYKTNIMASGNYRIMFLSSNPKNTDHLKVDEEFKKIRNKVIINNIFDIEIEPSVSVRDFQERLVNYKPQIVHFSGHGEVRKLAFTDNEGAAEEVQADALANVFNILNGRGEINDEEKIKLVVLNACYSNTLATRISQYVDCVIGMEKPISDDSAIAFSE